MHIKMIFFLIITLLAQYRPESNSLQRGLNGKWKSVHAEKTQSGTFSIRQFSFHEEQWEVRFTVYTDSLLQHPIFTFRAVGEYQLQQPGASGQNTMYAIFHFNHKFIKPETTDTALLRTMGVGACGLRGPGEKEITNTGCGYFTSREECPAEYDLVKLTNDTLYLGARPAAGGMCDTEKRPVLLGLPLKRIG
ncbi:MAG: hypothetical protein EOO05_05495 [Chitinophagaceae bacterium]|nr:MAG: hypothetical protein EOO05_05495 [Chitinophagaceae bacterium]